MAVGSLVATFMSPLARLCRPVMPLSRELAAHGGAAKASANDKVEPGEYSRSTRQLALLLLAVGVALRLIRLLIPAPIWGDEAMVGLNFMDRDYAGLTKALDHDQVAPVFFLWIERFVVEFLGTANWQVRLAPFLYSTGSLFLFWSFARRTVSLTAATIALGVLAVSVWPVSMAATAKPYSADLFWSLVLLVLATRWQQQPERLHWLIALTLAVPLALGNSYPTVFVAGAISLYLLPDAWKGRLSTKLWFAAYNLAMLSAFLTVYLFVGRVQIDPSLSETGPFMLWYWRHGFPPASLLESPLWFLRTNTGRMFAHPIGDSHFGSTATTLYFLLGIWSTWRSGNRRLLIVCLVPFALNLIAAILHKYPYGGCCRLAQHLAPAICLMVGVGGTVLLELLASTFSQRTRLLQWTAAVLILMGLGGLIFRSVYLDHDPIARFGQHLHDELKVEMEQGDEIAAMNLEMADVNTQWHLKRFGNRLHVIESGETLPQAERLWLISMRAKGSTVEAQDELIRKSGDWRIVRRMEFSVRPDPADEGQVWWYITLTCLAHPGDPRPAPHFNVAP